MLEGSGMLRANVDLLEMLRNPAGPSGGTRKRPFNASAGWPKLRSDFARLRRASSRQPSPEGELAGWVFGTISATG